VLLEAFSFSDFRRKNVISAPLLFFFDFLLLDLNLLSPSLSRLPAPSLFFSETKERQKKVITLLSFVDQQQLVSLSASPFFLKFISSLSLFLFFK